ncbi:peptide ABC transporter substrate-binding protein [Chengkuizengella sp. SCS-71B]|uniref:peptide ABC transporter substrate-binding protein n=1 Tax=Chengkuizengella sp. SCS-71B TaxID=3115290 RepID=UPI0032C21B21
MMKKGFKISFLTVFALIFVMGLALVGCSEDTTTEPEEVEKTEDNQNDQKDENDDENSSGDEMTEKVFRASFASEPPSLDPGQATDTTSSTVLRGVFEGLTRITPDGAALAGAENVEISDDYLTYTFTLRDHSWTNGDPVTAHDYEYAWKRVLDPAFAADYAYQLYYIKNAEAANTGKGSMEDVGVKALDDKTLEVTLENPTPYIMDLFAFTTYKPVNKKVVEANETWANDAGDLYVSNGPFKLDIWEHGNEIQLVKNDDYWDADTVQLDRIIYAVVEDEGTVLALYEDGELDWAGSPFSSLPTDSLPILKEQGLLTTQIRTGTYMYKFNVEKEPFNNKKIRQAFSYAIDRQSIIDHVAQGEQIPAMGLVPPNMELVKEPYFQDNNVERAKELFDEGLKELGYASADDLPPLVISHNTSEGHQKIAQAVQEQWRQVFGIELTLENAEWGVYLDQIDEGDFQIARYGWIGDFNDPINFLEIFKEIGGNNNTRWHNEEYARLLDLTYSEGDIPTRTQLLKDAEVIFMDEMPIAPVFYYTYNYVFNPEIKGIFLDSLGNTDLKWAHY